MVATTVDEDPRGWIWRTALDPDSPGWAWRAALQAALRHGLLEQVLRDLGIAVSWLEADQRDIRGRRAHLAERYPALHALDGGEAA